MRHQMVQVIEDAAGFESLRDEWNALLQESDSDCFFLTCEWLSTWWRNLSGRRKLRILAFHCGGELSAIAPLAVSPPRLTRLVPFPYLEFLGTGSVGSDYLDLIVRRGKEQEVLPVLAQCMAGGKLMLELAQLKRGVNSAARVAALLQQRGWHFSETPTNVCPWVNLRGHSWESYLATLGGEHRYNFRRRLKNLHRQFEFCFEQVCSEEQRHEALALLLQLHAMRWRGRGGSDAFYTPALVAFHEELSRLALACGWLRLYVLRLDGRPVASLYGFRYRKTFYFYQSGFDPSYARHSVGLVTMGLAIRSALEEGVEEYDLLHGAETYKSHWANGSRELVKFDLYPPRMLGLIYRQSVGAGRTVRRLARRLLPESLTRSISRGTEPRG